MARELQLGSGPLANLSHSGTHRQQVEELWELTSRVANFFVGSGNDKMIASSMVNYGLCSP